LACGNIWEGGAKALLEHLTMVQQLKAIVTLRATIPLGTSTRLMCFYIEAFIAWLCTVTARRPPAISWIMVKHAKLPIMGWSATMPTWKDLEGVQVELAILCLLVSRKRYTGCWSCSNCLRILARRKCAKLVLSMCETANGLAAIFAIAKACLVLRRVIRYFVLGMSKVALFTTWTHS